MQSFSILYIDDDADDLFIMQEAIKDLHPEIYLFTAKSSEEGLQVLENLDKQKKPLPALIIVDMNMPKVDGKQLLVHLKSSDKWASIPFVLYTTSISPEDINFCKQYGVLCVNKPMGFTDINDAIKQLLGVIKRNNR